ncbi:MAG: TolC family protein [Phycisphaerales bacterium]|nr:TolC family protein [Phycisphaerales bacterium]
MQNTQNGRSLIHNAVKGTLVSITGYVLIGCQSPLDSHIHEGQIGNITHLLNDEVSVEEGLSVSIQAVPDDIEEPLVSRMGELNTITPITKDLSWPSEITTSLNNEPLGTTTITVEEAVQSAIANNLDLELAKLEPAISKQAEIQAEAVFDYLFAASATQRGVQLPQQQTVVGGIPTGVTEVKSSVQAYEASLAKKLTTGGLLTFSTDVTGTHTKTTGVNVTPDPSWETVGSIDFRQPLLRGFGEKVVTSEVQLAKNASDKAIQEFRQSLHETITNTETAYLQLALQWRTLQVQEWLLEQGESVVEILELRRAYDTSEADYAQAVATVKQRAADVISQQAVVQNASDALKILINSPELPIESTVVIRPTGTIEVADVLLSLRETIISAVQNRPDLQVLKLSVDDQIIKVRVAKNETLPQLDLQAQLSSYGLDSGVGNAYSEVFDGDYLNHLVGLSFEQPVGNRMADANYTSSRLSRIAAITSYNKGLQRAIAEVKDAMRNVATNAELISANTSYRIAQAENLRALLVEEETLSGLTPTFLNLKLQTQSGLANARIAEFTATVNFNISLAALYLASGTTLEMHQISIDDAMLAE